jgi:hypothetical protein
MYKNNNYYAFIENQQYDKHTEHSETNYGNKIKEKTSIASCSTRGGLQMLIVPATLPLMHPHSA